MELLLNPNVAYVLIVVTALLLLAAVIIPGTGVPEVTAAFCLVLVVYEVYNLGFNAWAALVMAASILPFWGALRATRTWRMPLLALTIVLLGVGSVFLFTDARGFPSVDPVLATIVSLLLAGSIWFGAERIISAMHIPPANANPDTLIGKTGEARSEVGAKGSVQIGAELWSARSESPIQAGSAVRVIGRDGFVLIIQKESA
jgi:membrane-bound serine protease (ClpP class)